MRTSSESVTKSLGLSWVKCQRDTSPIQHTEYRGFRITKWSDGKYCVHPWPEGYHAGWVEQQAGLGRVMPSIDGDHHAPCDCFLANNDNDTVECIYIASRDPKDFIDTIWNKAFVEYEAAGFTTRRPA